MKLSGKIAVITGGNSGIGFGIARRLADEGAKGIIIGRNQKTHRSGAINGFASSLDSCVISGRFIGHCGRLLAAWWNRQFQHEQIQGK
jgi:NAD(P)-dependent dehydrogenase (short-subunit alcohol dehydrogenase family)